MTEDIFVFSKALLLQVMTFVLTGTLGVWVRPVAAIIVNQFPPKDNDCSKSDLLRISYQLDEDCCSPWTSGRNEVTPCQGSLNCFRPKNRRCVLRRLAGAEEVWLTYCL